MKAWMLDADARPVEVGAWYSDGFWTDGLPVRAVGFDPGFRGVVTARHWPDPLGIAPCGELERVKPSGDPLSAGEGGAS